MVWRSRAAAAPSAARAGAGGIESGGIESGGIDSGGIESGGIGSGERVEQSFEDFVRGASTSLHRTAYLLTGSREAAQDVVQTALTRVYLAWERHTQWDNPTAYARQVVVNTVLTNARRHWSGELAQADIGDRELAASPDRSGEVAERDALRRALHALPLRQRTAVVLRHYLDLSEAQTAAEMGAPVGTVKSLTARGLDALRTQMQEIAS
jgi:RNA polymerase sigma-70 factor (ECF subfamily)